MSTTTTMRRDAFTPTIHAPTRSPETVRQFTHFSRDDTPVSSPRLIRLGPRDAGPSRANDYHIHSPVSFLFHTSQLSELQQS